MKLLKITKRVISSCNTQRAILHPVEDIHPRAEEWNRALPYEAIPGPTPLPLLGNTWRFIPYIGDFEIAHVDKVSRKLYEKYGKVVKMEGLLGRPDMVFLFDPDEIERVYKIEDETPYRPSMPSLNYYKHVHRKDFFRENCGVIGVHGKQWQNFRSKVNKIMLQPKIAKMYVASIEGTAKEFVQRIEKIKNCNEEVPPDFIDEIHKWSLESLARIALDVRLGCLDDELQSSETQTFIKAVNTFFMNVPVLELKVPFWRLWNTPTFKKYIEALDFITEFCMKHIETALHRLKHTKPDRESSVLLRVLKMNDAKTATNLALDMFLVGIDTTSNAVASMLYQLSLHHDKQNKLYEEISQFLPNKNTPVTHEILQKMVYLKACIKETLRMYPVVIGNGRCTTSDRVIAGYQIPKGVQIIFQHCVISNLDKYFPKSDVFLPERWLKDSVFNKNYHPFAALPFGFGKRMCLGRRFADLEMQIVLIEVIRNYRVEYHYKRLDYHIHPMYTPNGPLKLRFVERD